MFTLISEQYESFAAFHMLREFSKATAASFLITSLDGRAGLFSVRCTGSVNWVVWAVLEPSPPRNKEGEVKLRFWNCFGVQDPTKHQMLKITLGINPPHQGENRRVAGLFARDEQKRVYIAHTGRVGGGRSGVGMKEFRTFLGGRPLEEIEASNGTRTAVVFGPIDAAVFPSQLAISLYGRPLQRT